MYFSWCAHYKCSTVGYVCKHQTRDNCGEVRMRGEPENRIVLKYSRRLMHSLPSKHFIAALSCLVIARTAVTALERVVWMWFWINIQVDAVLLQRLFILSVSVEMFVVCKKYNNLIELVILHYSWNFIKHTSYRVSSLLITITYYFYSLHYSSRCSHNNRQY